MKKKYANIKLEKQLIRFSKTKFINALTIVLIVFNCNFTTAQINADSPPFVLTVEELKNWTETGATADASNIATVPVAPRFSQTSTQLDGTLSNDMEIMLVPDGMSSLANYIGEQTQFNLYNFTHWSYVDKLVWFGGPILIPSAPWVNTAHKNGVKVYGTLFFGDQASIISLLEQDSSGFIAAQKMADIAAYYNFDGWFFNMETSTTSANAQLIREFVEQLTSILPANKEAIWYDAMLPNGIVSWQNQLNSNNSSLFQDGATRVSDNMFINFFWSGTTLPNNSRATAQALGRSEYEVFTGVDLWPSRNQAPFESGGNTWMGHLHDTNGTPKTSLGLFVPNALFQNDNYSSFNAIDNETERVRFYEAERHFFGGLDQNPEAIDVTGFKGISNWVPATSVITSLPFETSFNTGHGRIFATEGMKEIRDWHDMGKQDILPTWQFALQGNSNLTTTFDFTKPYHGGTSLNIEGTIASTGNTKLKLYKTQLDVSFQTKIDVTYALGNVGDTHMDVFFAFSDDPTTMITRSIGSSTSSGWNIKTIDISEFSGRELALIGFQFSSNTTVNNYSMNIGRLKVFNGAAGEGDLPIANFEADITAIPIAGSVNFSSASTTGATSWAWSFPGGTPSMSTDENPVITYNTAGTYDVELTVTNANGSDTEIKTLYINVDDEPMAAFTASTTAVNLGGVVNFTNNSVIATSYLWSFPGGTPSSSTDENPIVTYNTQGLHDVTLTATNSIGSNVLTKVDHIGVVDTSDIDHTDPVGTGIITARAEINVAESKERAFDNLATPGPNGSGQNVTWSKWLDNGGVPSISNPSWIQIELPEAKTARTMTIVSANGAGRFAEDFALLGSNDGINYDVLQSWENEPFIDLFLKKTLPFNNTTPYTHYKLEVYKNEADVTLTEITEIELRGPESSLGVDDFSSIDNQIHAYPNPTKNSSITLKGQFPENTTVEVFNIVGKSVLKPLKIDADTYTLSLEGIASGIYIMKLKNPQGFSENIKIVIE